MQKRSQRAFALHFTQLAQGQVSAFFLPQAAPVPYSWTVIRCGFQLFVDIVVYPAKLFFARDVGCQGHDPKCRVLLVPKERRTFVVPSWQRGNYLFLFIASGSSNSIQLEGCSCIVPGIYEIDVEESFKLYSKMCSGCPKLTLKR